MVVDTQPPVSPLKPSVLRVYAMSPNTIEFFKGTLLSRYCSLGKLTERPTGRWW